MSLIANTHPTLSDVVKRMDPDGTIARIVEMLNQKNAILDDLVVVEGNLPTGHRTTIRTGIPEPTWRMMYQGVQPTRSTTVQVTDSIGNLEAYAEVDKDLANLNGNTEAFRLSEDSAHIEGMNKEMAETLFYGDERLAPAEFTGLAPRFNDSTAENASQLINAGGTSNLTSIWGVVWGPNTIHGLYPKGSTGGLAFRDLGEVTIENIDGSGGRMQAYRSHYKWQCGLTVRDWRYAFRICNVDSTGLFTESDGVLENAKKLVRLLIEASERLEDTTAGRPVIYANRRVITALRLGILEKIAANLTWETVAGRRVIVFDDIPVRRVDALHNNETQVTFAS